MPPARISIDELVAADGTGPVNFPDGLTVQGVPVVGGGFYDIAGGTNGAPSASAIIATFDAPRAFTLPAGLTGSRAVAGTAATASTTFTIKKNGSSIGSIVWGAAATVATFTFASAVSFAAGDVLTVTAPASPDATLANIGFTLVGAL